MAPFPNNNLFNRAGLFEKQLVAESNFHRAMNLRFCWHKMMNAVKYLLVINDLNTYRQAF